MRTLSLNIPDELHLSDREIKILFVAPASDLDNDIKHAKRYSR